MTSPSPKNGVLYDMPPRYANGHISATGDPIHFMFGSRVGFFRVGGSNDAIYGSNKSKMAATAMLEKFQVAISPQRGRPIHFMFCSLRWGFRAGGSNGAIFVSNKLKMAAAVILDNFEWPCLRNGSRSTYTLCSEKKHPLTFSFISP